MPGPGDQQAESFAPWCWITIGVGTNKITVGNESYQGDPNTACIKSMEIGWVDEPSMKCEIVDEKGGTLQSVANAVRKCVRGGGTGSMCQFQFGWIVTTCYGGPSVSHVIPSETFNLQLVQLDVSYSEGKIKYTIEGKTVNTAYDVSRADRTFGSQDKPIKIEEAINALCAIDPPCTVRYMEITPGGSLRETKFDWAITGKVLGYWQCDNMSKISVISKWLAPFRIKDGKCDKGIVIFYNPRKYDELILLKDPSTGPGEASQCAPDGSKKDEFGPLGTFIVNGGKCSTVIEFSPTMNIINAKSSAAVGGGTSGPNKTSSQLAEEKRCENQQKDTIDAGTQLQATITQQAVENYGTKTANDQSLKSEIAHHKASLVTSTQNPGVHAELKILGNPSARFTWFGAMRNMSIVVINPYHIRKSGSTCGDWLAYPACNELFTNKNWKCEGINHSISNGSYTTTIKAMLVAPDIQVSADDPLGGQGGGGPTLENTC